MKKIVLQMLVCFSGLFLTSCTTVQHLNSTNFREITIPNIVGANDLSMAIDVRAPDNLPMAKRGGLDEFSPVNQKTLYSLRMVFDQACLEGIKSNFRVPEPGELTPYKIEMAVTRSSLVRSAAGVEYTLAVAFSLQNAQGQRVMGRTLQTTRRSSFDGINLPSAVSEASKDIVVQAMRLIASDTHTMVLLQTARPIDPRNQILYECDIQVLDLSGRRIIGTSGRANTQARLRELADELASQLEEKWIRSGIPKVAVLDFRTVGGSGEQEIGAVFSRFFENALEKKNLCQIIDRRSLDLIMQEHDLRSADVSMNPLQLENVQISIDTVQFFISGQVSILEEK